MTLIELVLVIAVGSVLVLGLVMFSREQVERGVQARDLVIAANLVELKMAQMNNTAFASIPTGNVTLASEASFPGFQIQRRVSNVTSRGGFTLRLVDIRVRRVGGSFNQPLARALTYRQSAVTFGDGV